ncbi:MAG: hypothetical protein WA323_18695, partial [Candidatus Nitrosopolaris sp.]
MVNHSTYVRTNKISFIEIYDLHGSFVIVMAQTTVNPLLSERQTDNESYGIIGGRIGERGIEGEEGGA